MRRSVFGSPWAWNLLHEEKQVPLPDYVSHSTL